MSEKSENNTKTENISSGGDSKTTTIGTTTVTATQSSAITTTIKPKKKTVTFKNILETSDDNIVKKVYNPDFSVPLIPIIKKDCLNYIYKTDIVKPSRLTETLEKNNKKNNYHINNDIDKLRSISFKSSSFTFPISNKLRDADTVIDTEPKAVTTTTTTTGSTTAGGGCTIGDKRFILPKLSAHSRRIIKPNKRFLDDENNGLLKNRKNCIKKSIVRKLKVASNNNNKDVEVHSDSNKLNVENNCDENENNKDDEGSVNTDSDESVSSHDDMSPSGIKIIYTLIICSMINLRNKLFLKNKPVAFFSCFLCNIISSN